MRDEDVQDDAAIAKLLGSVTLMGLSATLGELEKAGSLPHQARLRIRAFMSHGIEEVEVPERIKAHVRSMLRAHFPNS